MFVSFAYTDNLFRNLYSLCILGVCACDEGVGFSGFDHHHTEVIAVEHLFMSFGVGHALALSLFCKKLCVADTAVFFVRMPQIDNLHAR